MHSFYYCIHQNTSVSTIFHVMFCRRTQSLFFKNVQYMELMLVFKTSCTLNSLNFYNNMYGQRHAVQKESNLILCVNLFNTRDRLTAQTELKTLIVQRIYAQENLYVFRSYVVLIHGLLVRHQFLVFKNLLTFLSESFILNSLIRITS